MASSTWGEDHGACHSAALQSPSHLLTRPAQRSQRVRRRGQSDEPLQFGWRLEEIYRSAYLRLFARRLLQVRRGPELDRGSGQLAFARTTNGGATWIGVGAQPAGSGITGEMIFGEINVASDGTIYVFGLDDGGSAIEFVKSTDGGQSFSAAQPVATGITQ